MAKPSSPTAAPAKCPWCGLSGRLIAFDIDEKMRQTYTVICESEDLETCGARGPERPTRAEAVNEWNRVSRRSSRSGKGRRK